MYEVHVSVYFSVTVVALQLELELCLHCEQSLHFPLLQSSGYTQLEHPSLFAATSGAGAFGAGAGAVADVVLGVATFDTDTGS